MCLTALGLFLVLPIFLLLWSALLCLMHCLLPGPFGWTLSLRTCLILILIWFYSWSLQVLFFFVLGLLSIIFFALQHKAQFCFHPEPNSHILPSVSFLSLLSSLPPLPPDFFHIPKWISNVEQSLFILPLANPSSQALFITTCLFIITHQSISVWEKF